MKQVRYSKKSLEQTAENLRHYGHDVALFYGIGTSVYMDGVWYDHKRKDGTKEGLSNQKAHQIMWDALYKEIKKEYAK